MSSITFTPPASERDRAPGLQTLLGGIALALVVPVIALSGLAVPLPGAVVRLAVDLVEQSGALAARLGGASEPAHETPVGVIRLQPAPEPVRASPTPRAARPAARSAVVVPHARPHARVRTRPSSRRATLAARAARELHALHVRGTDRPRHGRVHGASVKGPATA